MAAFAASSVAAIAGTARIDVAAELGIAPEPIGNVGDWFPQDSYPASARQAEEEGRVTFRLDVDATGAVTGCTIVGSSGSAALDAATCDLARANGRFKPAHGPDGKPIASNWTKTTKWEIEEDAPIAAKSASIVGRIDVSATGEPLSCNVQYGGAPLPDFEGLCEEFKDPGQLLGFKGPFGDEHAIVTIQMALLMAGDPPVRDEHKVKGRTVVSVTRSAFDIAPDGSVTNCRVIESETLLDPLPLCSMALGPFVPATGKDANRMRSATQFLGISVEQAKP